MYLHFFFMGRARGEPPPGACSPRCGRCSPYRSCRGRICIHGGAALSLYLSLYISYLLNTSGVDVVAAIVAARVVLLLLLLLVLLLLLMLMLLMLLLLLLSMLVLLLFVFVAVAANDVGHDASVVVAFVVVVACYDAAPIITVVAAFIILVIKYKTRTIRTHRAY